MAEVSAPEVRGGGERSPDRIRDRSPSRSSLPRDERGRNPKVERKRGDNNRRYDNYGDKRERDRDNKRRKSSSPPYHDRRYSPRRSPSHKRYAYSNASDKSLFDHGRGYRKQGPSRYQDWSRSSRSYDNYRGDYPNESQRDNDALLSYKHFILDLEDDISPSEAQKRYEEYKSEFTKSKKITYFNQHKDEDRFRERYDPLLLEQYISERNKTAQTFANAIMEKLKKFDLDVGPDADEGLEELKGEGEDDAKRKKQWDKRVKDAESAVQIPSFFSQHERIQKDITQCMSLMKKLDKEKEITNNLLTKKDMELTVEGKEDKRETLSILIDGNNGSKNYSGVDFLDILLTYLWRVHGFDYYGAIELKESPKGYRHVREKVSSSTDATPPPPPSSSSSSTPSSSEWEKKVDDFYESRSKEQSMDPLVARMEKEKVDASVGQTLDGWVKKIHDEKYTWKYGCGVKGCGKVFHGPEFVLKHLNLKHPDLVKEITVKVTREIFVNNFINDDSFSLSDLISPQHQQQKQLQQQQPHQQQQQQQQQLHQQPQSQQKQQLQKQAQPQPMLLDRPPKKRGYEYNRGDDLDGKEHSEHGDRDYSRTNKPGSEFDEFGRPSLESSAYDRRPLHQNDFAENGMFQGKGPEGEAGGRFGVGVGVGGDEYSLDGFEEGSQRMFPPGPGLPNQPPPYGVHEGAMFEPFEPSRLQPHRPFDHPIPPPMLIPVPGAGPLGPFVPAPPDVAMRMMRERGPRPNPMPPFFDAFEERFDGEFEGAGTGAGVGAGVGAGGVDGRHLEGALSDFPKPGRGFGSGTSRGLMGVPPQGMRQDPRGMRTYHDLDAPDDDIQVIDYRSV